MIEFLNGAFSVLLVRGERITETLKNKTDVPPPVVERCRRAVQNIVGITEEINEKLVSLELIGQTFENGKITAEQADIQLKKVLLAYRDLRRTIDAIEENFVGHIVRFNKSDLFFTRVAETLWEETNLPDLPPVAVTNTSGYFCTWASMGIVFSPPSTEHNLLIFPDLYHEFGHILQKNVKLYSNKFSVELKAHVAELKNQIRRTARPIEPKIIDNINYIWNKNWAEEVACDTLATCIIGPAYGWCNLHLCLQNSSAYLHGGKHPADAARTRHILRVLRRRGFGTEANKINELWNRYASISQQTSSNYYQDYHPDSLFIAVMEDVEDAIKDMSFVGIEENTPTVAMLNQAWKLFNENSKNYNEWEEKAIKELKTRLELEEENE